MTTKTKTTRTKTSMFDNVMFRPADVRGMLTTLGKCTRRELFDHFKNDVESGAVPITRTADGAACFQICDVAEWLMKNTNNDPSLLMRNLLAGIEGCDSRSH